MVVDLYDLLSSENKETDQEVSFQWEVLPSATGGFPVLKTAPFILHVRNVNNKVLKITCSVDLTVSIPCDRCLEDTERHFTISVDEELKLDGMGGLQDDVMDAVDYLSGSKLDVDKLVYGEILVNWPVKVLCREDCRGICKKCGVNLNFQTCDCDQTELDPRMAVIQDIFNNYKEV